MIEHYEHSARFNERIIIVRVALRRSARNGKLALRRGARLAPHRLLFAIYSQKLLDECLAKGATVAKLWLEYGMTALALVEELAGVSLHDFLRAMAAMWARRDRVEFNARDVHSGLGCSLALGESYIVGPVRIVATSHREKFPLWTLRYLGRKPKRLIEMSSCAKVFWEGFKTQRRYFLSVEPIWMHSGKSHPAVDVFELNVGILLLK